MDENAQTWCFVCHKMISLAEGCKVVHEARSTMTCSDCEPLMRTFYRLEAAKTDVEKLCDTVASWNTRTSIDQAAKAVAFREWLDEVNGYAEELPANSFKESGTAVNTMLIMIEK